LVTGSNDWWKKAICHKYLIRNQRKNMDLVLDNKAGSFHRIKAWKTSGRHLKFVCWQREAGAGGVLYDPRGTRVLDFSWNLGIASNNVVEAYVVYQGLLLMQEDQINQISIVGDSKNTIRYFVKGSSPKDAKIKRIIERI
jgi:hypothetical protein